MAKSEKTVVFDTSVILSGLASSSGASAKLLALAQKRKIQGVISATIIRESLKHAQKLHLTPEKVAKKMQIIFVTILPAPQAKLVDKHTSRISDPDDAHLLATAIESNAHYLVTLDKHHVLALAEKIPNLTILPPAELLRLLKRKKS